MSRALGWLWLSGYVGTIVVANWLIERFGDVPVFIGLTAPAGVYAAGLAFTFRDLTHEAFGRRGALGAIAAGGVLSWLVSDGVTLPGGVVSLAVASSTAFLLSELADLAVYSRFRARYQIGALLASNVVGIWIDSALFLLLAFGSLDLLIGQVVGKWWVTLVAVALLWPVRARLLPAERAR